MKKIVALFLALISMLSLVACTGKVDVSIVYETPLPWVNAIGYEKSVYKIEKYTRLAVDKTYKDDKLVASGTYTTEISSADDENFVLKTSFEINYVTTEDAITTDSKGNQLDNRGLTDTMTSEVRFKHMSPSYSEKTFVVAPRPAGKTQLIGYNYITDYDKLTTTVTYGSDTKTIGLEVGTKIDNEQLMPVIRAMKGVAAKGKPAFYLNSPLDMYETNKYLRYSMTANCADSLLPVTLSANINKDNFLIKTKEGAVEANDAGIYTIPCVQVSVHKNDSLPGPDVKMLVTDAYYSFAERVNIPSGNEDTSIVTSKLIAEMRYAEYDVPKAREMYNTVYTLTNYTTRKAI